MTDPFTTRTGQVEQFAADFARRLLWITGRCRPDMHEPDEQGLKRVTLVGDHLDNAMGEMIDQKMILEGYQEFVLVIAREALPGQSSGHEAFNLATLIAFARIGARAVMSRADQDVAWKEPQIPGDSVREVKMKKGREIGDVRIQDYRMTLSSPSQKGASIRVASFLPGVQVCTQGDTPKTEPENSVWCATKEEANDRFQQFVDAAVAEGWMKVGG